VAQKRAARKLKTKLRTCPECGSTRVIPIIHGVPTSAEEGALRRGEAILANREEWEGMTEWYCQACGCDWSRSWRRYKQAKRD
jgi:hypothetical protein